MNDLLSFRGKKTMTRDEGIMLVCLTKNGKPYFFYMYTNGKRFISYGDVKSGDGQISDAEWKWARTWGNFKEEKLSETELPLAVKLWEELQKDKFFGCSEDNHTARSNYMAKKIKTAMGV